MLRRIQKMSVCYFTYSWEKDAKKAEPLNLLLSYIRSRIEKLSDGNVSVLYDKECFKEGDNFREREKQLDNSDCILLFFTPEYKNKVEAQDDTGVYREYQMIRERAKSEYNGVIPILLSGTLDTAVTDEFKDIIFWDISKIKHQINKSNGRIVLSDELETIVSKIVRKAIREAYAVSYCKGHVFSTIQELYHALFLDSAVTPLPPACIIRTTAHDKILDQSACVVIGRKGSGKSTLLESIQKQDPGFYYENYKQLISMNVESLDINFVYSNLICESRKEFNFIPMPKILDTFWELMFVLQGMVTIGCELESYRIEQDDTRYRTFYGATKKLKKLLGIPNGRLFTDLRPHAICHCAVELLTNHIKNELLVHASEETPLTAAFNSVDTFGILSKTFGRDSFKKYCSGVALCKKKIFFALDGFDTHSEDFRTTTNRLAEVNPDEYYLRKDFEIKLFRELLLSVSNVKQHTQPPIIQKFFNAVHFCIILPQDRYDEIALDDRDITKRSYCSLNWDAHDLMEMLVKRLEYFYKIEAQDDLPLDNRLYRIIKAKMPTIPTELSISIDGIERKIPLFNYLLRLTFWRPRDIIKNFAIIIELSKDQEDMSDYIESVIKKLLVNSAKNIIEIEFINEYKNVYLNLKEVLYRFKGTNFIQEYDLFCERLSKIHIQAVTTEKYTSIDSKLSLLYKLGVIGLFFDKDYAEKCGYGYHICYSFNEGLNPLDEFMLSERRSSCAKIVFNPIFVKDLALNYNTKELICDYSWQYIKTNHKLKDSIRRI